MFCKYCGEKLDDKLLEEKKIAYCTSCGKLNKKETKKTEKAEKSEELSKDVQKELNNKDSSSYETHVYTQDSGSVGWGILGFFFPIVGLILYLCWIKSSPRSANSAGAGALIAVVLEIILALVFVILSFFTNIQLPAEFFY